jgi:hypothetical protein
MFCKRIQPRHNTLPPGSPSPLRPQKPPSCPIHTPPSTTAPFRATIAVHLFACLAQIRMRAACRMMDV